ncbi:hypothetical protein BT67DRAFT_131887 [Trichocladium antarcticum]|uniref:Uncharacterized protein n=1 Tax=Trichocladium antarcticum TaxID=1450529 RepID=A0AAN6ZH05_9PEZI|nr:hypothetical protein BT67DRAFT_131887 [Trichocladium antarcticum]
MGGRYDMDAIQQLPGSVPPIPRAPTKQPFQAVRAIEAQTTVSWMTESRIEGIWRSWGLRGRVNNTRRDATTSQWGGLGAAVSCRGNVSSEVEEGRGNKTEFAVGGRETKYQRWGLRQKRESLVSWPAGGTEAGRRQGLLATARISNATGQSRRGISTGIRRGRGPMRSLGRSSLSSGHDSRLCGATSRMATP